MRLPLALSVAVLLYGCGENPRSANTASVAPTKEPAALIQLNQLSGYGGSVAMREFVQCALGSLPEAGKWPDLLSEFGIDAPPSLKDFLATADSSVLSHFHLLNPPQFAPLATHSQIDYDVFRINREFDSARHLDYGTRQDPAHAATGHFADDLIVVGAESNGAMYLLNPKVRTSDGEWEAWLWSHRLPGAFRFRSFAELLGHLYQEQQYAGTDTPRFGFDGSANRCARMLQGNS